MEVAGKGSCAIIDGVNECARAFRALRRAPAFALTVVVTLGIGMGVTAVVLDAARRAFVSPLPYADSSRLFHVSVRAARGDELPASLPEYEMWDGSTTTESLTAYTRTNRTLTGAGVPIRLAVTQVASNFFLTLGVPVVGRSFSDAEQRAGTDRVVIVTDRFRREHMNAQGPGSVIHLGGVPYDVVGVLPPGFRFDLDNPDVFIPLGLTPEDEGARDSHWLGVIVRLRQGTTADAASADLTAALARAGEAGAVAAVVPLRAYIIGSLKSVLLALFAGALLVVAAAASSVANLVAARIAVRRRELAIRAALGASARALWGLTGVELALLAVAGSGCAVLCAAWTQVAIERLLPAAIATRVGVTAAGVSTTVLGESIGLVFVATGIALLTAAADLRRASRASVVDVYGAGRGASAVTARRWLVSQQVAVSVVLLVGAALLGRSVARLLDAPLGFDTRNVLVAKLSLPPERYSSGEQVAAFYTRAAEISAQIPGVARAGVIDELPLTKDSGSVMASPFGSVSEADRVKTLLRSAGPGYFEAMGIALRAGRLFSDRDNAAHEPVVVVSSRLAGALFHDANPIGRLLTFGHPVSYRVIGVVDNVRMGELDREIAPAAYTCALQDPSRSAFLVLRSSLPMAAVLPALRARLAAVDPEVPVYSAQSLEQVRAATAGVARRMAVLVPVGLFGVLTLLVAAIGVHGILSYLVAQRVREIGIRMALGADRRTVLVEAVRQGLVPVAWGAIVGVLIAFVASRMAASLLFGAGPFDAAAFAGALAIMLASGVVACAAPALRASRLQPARALASDGQ